MLSRRVPLVPRMLSAYASPLLLFILIITYKNDIFKKKTATDAYILTASMTYIFFLIFRNKQIKKIIYKLTKIQNFKMLNIDGLWFDTN